MIEKDGQTNSKRRRTKSNILTPPPREDFENIEDSLRSEKSQFFRDRLQQFRDAYHLTALHGLNWAEDRELSTPVEGVSFEDAISALLELRNRDDLTFLSAVTEAFYQRHSTHGVEPHKAFLKRLSEFFSKEFILERFEFSSNYLKIMKTLGSVDYLLAEADLPPKKRSIALRKAVVEALDKEGELPSLALAALAKTYSQETIEKNIREAEFHLGFFERFLVTGYGLDISYVKGLVINKAPHGEQKDPAAMAEAAQEDLTARGTPRIRRKPGSFEGNEVQLRARVPDELRDRFNARVEAMPNTTKNAELIRAIEEYLENHP